MEERMGALGKDEKRQGAEWRYLEHLLALISDRVISTRGKGIGFKWRK
jgi:hypothetical protein